MSAESLPKYLDIARAIELQVIGKEGAKMPSSRAIAGDFGVSLVTASRAIQVLRDKGLIRTVERSGSYVAPASAPATDRECYALVQRSTPGPWFQASLAFSQAGFAVVQQTEGVRFELDRFHFDDTTRPVELELQCARAVEAGVAGVMFLPSRYKTEAAEQDAVFLKACRAAGLAVVLVERNLRGFARALEYDLVAADDFDGGTMCTQHLLDLGKRRIAFVIGSPTSSHIGRLAGYLTTLQQAGTGVEPLVLDPPATSASKDYYRELADQVLARSADGVVCYQDYTALGLVLELLKRGIAVPGKIAITGFDNLPIGKAYSIGVTTYAFSSEAVASHATRLMRARLANPAAPPVKLLIPGTLIVRESSMSAG